MRKVTNKNIDVKPILLSKKESIKIDARKIIKRVEVSSKKRKNKTENKTTKGKGKIVDSTTAEKSIRIVNMTRDIIEFKVFNLQ